VLVGHVALGDFDEVRDEVVAALELDVDLANAFLKRLRSETRVL